MTDHDTFSTRTIGFADRARLDRLIEVFAAALRAQDAPVIADFLPGAEEPDFRLEALAALARVEVEFRAERGKAPCLRARFDQFPELLERVNMALELVGVEFRARQGEGGIAPAEYYRQFPELNEPLRRLLPNITPRPPTPRRVPCSICGAPASSREDSTICGACGNRIETRDDPAHERPLPTNTTLGKYRLLERIGRGGFGDVYRAHDPQLDRVVAIKTPRRGAFVSAEEGERFMREARLIALATHPGVVPIHEVCRDGDVPFIAVEYIDGMTLADALTGRRFGGRESAQLMAEVAEIVENVHARGVIHRDLKPSNIMLQRRITGASPDSPLPGEKDSKFPRRGREFEFPYRARVTDFGLARRREGDASMTSERVVVGTPAYMSPEQAAGAGGVDHRSDIYSLGVILYELLVGERPFRGAEANLMEQVRFREPTPPRRLDQGISVELETVCLRAMAKEPELRFRSAGEMADELRRHLRGEPIRSRPLSRWNRLVRWVRGHRSTAALLAAVATLLSIVTIGSVAGAWNFRRLNLEANEIARRESAERARAREAESRARRQAELAVEQSALATNAERRAANEAEAALRSAAKAELEARTSRQVLSLVSDLFRSSDPLAFEGMGLRNEGEAATELSARRLLERAADQVEGATLDPLTRAYLFDLIGSPLLGAGNYERAERLLKGAYETRVERLPPNDPLIADSALHYGRLCHELVYPERAESLYREARATRERALSAAPMNAEARLALAEVDFHLARLIAENGAAAEAETMIRSVLTTRRDILGSEHRGSQIAEAALMILLAAQGKYGELSAVDPAASLKIVPTIAAFVAAQKSRKERDYDTSRREYLKSLEGASGVLSSEHPLIAMLEADFAGMLREAGDTAEAERYARHAFLTGRRMAPTHPRLLEVALPLAEIAESRQEHAAAADYLTTATRIARARFPEDTPRRVDLGSRLARALVGSKRSSEAAQVYLETLPLQRVRGSNAIAEQLLGELLPLLEAGPIDDPWLERARREIDLALASPGSPALPIAELRMALATALSRSDAREAATLKEQARDAIEAGYGPSHPFAARCRSAPPWRSDGPPDAGEN